MISGSDEVIEAHCLKMIDLNLLFQGEQAKRQNCSEKAYVETKFDYDANCLYFL